VNKRVTSYTISIVPHYNMRV